MSKGWGNACRWPQHRGSTAMHALTLPSLLLEQGARWGERTWVQAPGGALRYGDAPGHAAAWALRLAAAGVARGDRVGLMAGNRHEFLSIVLGCGWLGAVVVPVNTASRGMQLQHILANSGCRLLVADAASCPALAALDMQSLALNRIWLLDGDADALPVHACPPPPVPDTPLPPAADVGPGDTLAILYTSGTSGLSKGVCCPHAQFYWWGRIAARNLEIGASDVLYTSLPLFHTNALNACFQALVTGATIICDERFSASRYFDRLEATDATVTYLLGAMVPMLLAQAPAAAERRHRARIALAPGVPERFHAAFAERTGIALLEGYGSTETNFALGGTLAEQRPGTMGRAAPEFDAMAADEHDAAVPDGTPGELLLRAHVPYAIATGYFGMDDKTVQAWRNLWFHTGDRVVRDADGYFRFLDRTKDAIRRRGENISSYEVEQVLLAHPAVAAVAVYAVRSDLAEDEVMAALVYKAGQAIAPETLLDFCQPRMPYFAVPRYLRVLDDLPRTENGKIRKFHLRDEGITGDAWDRDAVGYRVAR
ncbi:ATP-dependent acyl-CoA ligase [Achromobacter xylosoxidans]|uniref:ATP-dependent acyl-CoA ligase n=1 Tax=Alcaligenes xylosoxydans xylosoxydans TaxID=85698 RepID=UPI00211B6209|nr:ATP-dependent acyl-CoA ligase [Achromobacter xylosoxidans]